jgi:hypothetical protein
MQEEKKLAHYKIEQMWHKLNKDEMANLGVWQHTKGVKKQEERDS